MKRVYKAEGGSHSWDWLALVSPCVEILRKLSTKINHELGTDQGSKHTTPNLEKDISILMKVLKEHDVYEVIPGRIVDARDCAVQDVISVGLAQLSHGNSTNPITAFNEEFNRLRERRKLTPISEELDFEMAESAVYAGTLAKASANSTERLGKETDNEENGNPPSGVLSDSEDDDSEEDPIFDPELDALLMASPTLERVNEEDVTLDMDGWELDPGLESEEEMSEESEGEENFE